MQHPTPDMVLRLWETGEPLDALSRAVALASVDDDAACIALGERDARLLELTGAVAGPVLESVTACPACGEQVSIAVGVEELLDLGRSGARDLTVDVRHRGHQVTARCLDSRDLAAAAATRDADVAERLLLERCVVRATGPDGAAVAATALPREVREAVDSAVAAADPLADVLVDLECPGCDAAFTAEVDVVAHAWTAIRRSARALLADVDALARAYGWTEPEVLALTETRRNAYLRLARGEAW